MSVHTSSKRGRHVPYLYPTCHRGWAAPVYGIEATRFRRVSRQKDRVWRDAVTVYGSGCLQVVDEQQTQLGDYVHQTILLAYLHCYRKVVRKFWWEEELCLPLHRGSTCSQTRQHLPLDWKCKHGPQNTHTHARARAHTHTRESQCMSQHEIISSKQEGTVPQKKSQARS
jgi:hypothetical protein